MATNDWRASVAFSERLSSNMKIKAAYKSTYPDLSQAELAMKASSVEEDIFKEAASLYKALCIQTCENTTALSGTRAVGTTEPPLPVNNNPVEDIGPYKAQYHASGLFSTVYRASAQKTGQTVAIKVTTPQRMTAPHDSEREARLLKFVSSAPAVIPLLSADWVAGGHFILAFPFIPSDLGMLLDQHKVTAKQQRTHLQALFTALDYIHSQGIIHRDVKPSNLLSCGPDGPAYLADFGIAWYADDPASELADQKITDVGTTCYRPPELLFGYKAYTSKLDMWAAGCVVAECLRDGKTLFEAGDLGSELALLRSIFTTMGTPDDKIWPEARNMPDWGKMQFTEYRKQQWQDVLPDSSPEGVELVAELVRFQSTERFSAAEVLKHAYFKR